MVGHVRLHREDLAATNAKLAHANAQLAAANRDLEQKVQQRTAQLQADSFTSTEKAAPSESAASDITDALPISSAAKANVLSSIFASNSPSVQK